jgi:VWFA-related protein
VRARIKNLALLLLSLPLSIAFSQNPKNPQKNPDRERPTFRLPVNLIVVNATVVDKNGAPVTDLARDDFKVYDDGKLQPIQTFAMESYESPILENAAGPNRTQPGDQSLLAGRSRPRMISLVVDDITAASWDNYPRVESAITKFVKEDMGADDQVAISAASGRAQFPFSSDKGVLLQEVPDLFSRLNVDRLTKSDCPTFTDLQAKWITESFTDDRPASDPAPRDSSNPLLLLLQKAEQTANAVNEFEDVNARVALEETILCLSLDPSDEKTIPTAKAYMRAAASRQHQEQEYRTGTLLYNLRAHLRSLKHFDATKSLILFSDGFIAEGVSHISYKLQDVVDQALTSGVILNAVDSRGLYTLTMPADQSAISLYSSTARFKQVLFLDDLAAQEVPLARMADDTGGLFYHNSNDLYGGLRQIAHRQSFYYVLTYAMPSQRTDGRLHQIKVELSRPGLDLSYRKGYYAPKEELTFERRKKEDILEAFRAPGNLNEIPLTLAYNYYQEDESTYRLALSTSFSIRGLHFLDEDSRRKNLIHLVVAAFDEMNHYVDGIEKSIDFKLTEASYTNILAYGVTSRVEFKLPMGRYKIKAVVREGASGKMGSTTSVLAIP